MKLPLILLFACALQAEQPHIKAAEAAYRDAKAAQLQKEFARSADLYSKAISIEPTFLEAHEGLIHAYLESGRRLDAAAATTRFLEISPDEVAYRVLLGQMLLDHKEPARALAQFSAALRLAPSDADGLLGFAAAALQMGMQDRAVEALERGRKTYPHDTRFIAALHNP